MKSICDFISTSNIIHNNFYDYSKVIFTKIREKVTIICPIHGEFEQVAGNHMKGSGCSKCDIQKRRDIQKLKFISKANIIHNNFYDYSKVKYINIKTKIKIICPIHGEFEQSPNNHLSGHGCKKCGLEKRKLNEVEFIKKCKIKHNNLYDYSKVKYINSSSKIKIICPIHGEFEQVAGSHLFGDGCKKCAILKNGILKYKNRKTTLYFIYFPKFNIYKVGLTRKDIDKRFSSEIKNGIDIITIFTRTFIDGSDAFKKEQHILELFKSSKYKGDDILETGNSELFNSKINKHLDKIYTYIEQ